ncbi:hypothetical protein Cpir12675_004601 [Ceratocystis pirilliformis]|uniref:Uncharacterized protein n=1 Tax=Ceratocystis pirilliformis TaxID=259994 RepID=A0ABR3YVI3_9PEZI
MPYAQPPPAFAPAGPPPPHMLQHPHNAHTPHSRYTGGSGSAGVPPVHHQVMTAKRSMPPHTSESPAKKQSKWSHEEDALIIELRGGGMKWEDISKRLPGRSAISCRLHYQNYLERRSEWDEERKNKLARLYERFKPEMWQKVAEEMAVPWRAAEAMHWRMGEEEMAKRAGVVPFSFSHNDSSSHRSSLSRGHSQPPPPRADYVPPHMPPQHHNQNHPVYGRHQTMHSGHAHTHSHSHSHSHSMGMGMGMGQNSQSGHNNVAPPPPHPPTHHMAHGSHIGPVNDQRSIPTPGPPLPPSLPRRDQGPAFPPPIPHERQPSPHAELAPVNPPTQNRNSGGMLPSVAELTTGISPYSTPAYSVGGGGSTSNASPVSKPDLSPPGQSQLPSMAGYPPASEAQAPPVYETTGSKRRASPDLMPRDSRRRYFEHPDDAARRRMA